MIKKLIKNKNMEIETKWAHNFFMNKLKGSCINQLNVEEVMQVGTVRENDKGRFSLGFESIEKKKIPFLTKLRLFYLTNRSMISVVFYLFFIIVLFTYKIKTKMKSCSKSPDHTNIRESIRLVISLRLAISKHKFFPLLS